MREVLGIIRHLAEVGSTKAKSEIIKKHLPGNELFQKVVKYALDQDKSYNVTELVNTDGKIISPSTSVEQVFGYLDYLVAKRGATAIEIMHLSRLCTSVPGAEEIVTKIIQKDLKCGCGAKAFNAVIPGLVFEVPYQRFSGFKEFDKIDFENDTVVAQIKMDGMFSYLMPDGSFLSRNGSRYSLGGVIERDKEWISQLGSNLIWMGELLVRGTGGSYLPRKTSNGIINSFISGDGNPMWINRVEYVTWGYITHEDFRRGYSDTTYEEMLNSLNGVKVNSGKIFLSKTDFVRDKDEALVFYKNCRIRKEEGAMIKVINKLKWKSESSGSKFCVKLKPVAEAEFEIVGAYYGDKKGRYAAALGGLIVKSCDDKILTKLGGGFSDDDRFLGVDWWGKLVGRVVTAQFTGITTDKTSRETYCLDHGRFVELRNDKDCADSYEYCLGVVNNG